MSGLRTVLEITRWEFVRWFKIKSQIVTLVIAIFAGLIFSGARYLLEQGDTEPVNLVVINGDILPQLATEESRIVLALSDERSEEELRAAVGRRELDGLLILRSIDSAELIVYKSPRWEVELLDLLNAARHRIKLALLNLSTEQLADAMTPYGLEVILHEASGVKSTLAEKIVAGILVVMMLIGIFNSLAYQMVTITGEKQLRVTEQIISAVTPQQWIDGKIIGLSAFATITTLVFALSTVICALIMHLAGQSLPIPVGIGNPLTIGILILVTIGGFLFWNTFLAAVAATINDPNTSSRSGMLFLPLMPSIIGALLAVKFPESTWMTLLSFLPITTPVVLPVRLVMTQVPLWETAVAVFLLYVACWYMRIVAGKIFHLGILMYGKEPSLREMIRWMREA